jgi:hypothetical protein
MPRPKKAKLLIPKTAKDCNLDEELVEDVVDFFYLQLRKKIELIEVPYISIPILGRIYVNKRKLEISIVNLGELLQDERINSDFRNMKRYQKYLIRREQHIKVLQKLIESENEREQLRKDLEQSK